MSLLVVLYFYASLQTVATSASSTGAEADVSSTHRSMAYQPGFSAVPKPPKVMGAINKYRAKICADMKDEHGEEFSSYEACDKFMRKACHPGRDGRMDGDRKEISSGEGYCKVFFNPAAQESDAKDEDLVEKAAKGARVVKKKAKEVVDKAKKAVDRDQEKSSGSGDDEEKQKEDRPKPKARMETGHGGHHVEHSSDATIPAGVAPAPAPAGAPAAYRPTEGDTVKILSTANTKESFPEGIGKDFVIEADRHTAKPYQVQGSSAWLREGDVQLTKRKVIGPDEKWYYKNGGIDEGRFHMDEDLKLPTQGYWGKLVEHEDMETSTGDWQQEFGRKNSPSRRKICETHPENIWCQRYVDAMNAEQKSDKSSATASIFHHATLVVLGIFLCRAGMQ